jgi:hypothetical protein
MSTVEPTEAGGPLQSPAGNPAQVVPHAQAPVPPGPDVKTQDPEKTSTEKPEWAWGAIVVIAGLIAIVAVFVVAVIHYPKATEVTTAVGAVSGVIAALVGAYFGIRGSSLAQTKAESRSSKGSL